MQRKPNDQKLVKMWKNFDNAFSRYKNEPACSLHFNSATQLSFGALAVGRVMAVGKSSLKGIPTCAFPKTDENFSGFGNSIFEKLVSFCCARDLKNFFKMTINSYLNFISGDDFLTACSRMSRLCS